MLRHTYKCFLCKSSQQHKNWVNQQKQGTLKEPFVFVIHYNLNAEYIFGTKKKTTKKQTEQKNNDTRMNGKNQQNILTSLTSNSHSCKHIQKQIKQKGEDWTDTMH